MGTKAAKPLAELVQELAKLKAQFDEEPNVPLPKPCSPKQIAALEKRIGRPLPASYRSFLELHNGWNAADGGYAYKYFLSVEDQDLPWVKDRVVRFSGYFNEQKLKNPFDQGAIPIQLGEDEHVWIAMIPKTAKKNGGMDFVEYDICHEQSHFKSFTDILKRDLGIFRSLLKGSK